jgi:hypothetical protein
MKSLIIRLTVAVLLLPNASVLGDGDSEPEINAAGWKSVSPRDEIRPAFELKPNGGPRKRGSLTIRTDSREGLDGHWAKAFLSRVVTTTISARCAA